MADIFCMDDELDIEGDFDKKLNLNRLNYRLVDGDDESEVRANDNENEEGTNGSLWQETEGEEDEVSELGYEIRSKTQRERRDSGFTSSSIEIDINEAYVSSLNRRDSGGASAGAPNSCSTTNFKPKLADFEPIKVLGKGAYGKVLLVREIATGRLFAQKQLKKASLIINETKEIHETNYRRTLNEKSILEMVNHPNVVKLYYAFQDNNKVYLILEYLDGGELFHHLAQERFMSEKNASYYIAQMMLALIYLHKHLGVIYRDLKPENCMLNCSGNLVLTDFGLSKVSSEEEKNHSITGTAQYMAPEILKNEAYGYGVDWWSLGCVAYDLLTGGPPFTGNNNKKIMDKIVSAKKTLKFPFYLSNDAKDFLRKLLQPNPSKRFDVDNDFETIKNHRFFRYLDWNQLERIEEYTEVLPPILPIVTDPVLAENFDSEFTEMAFTPQQIGSHFLSVNGKSPADVLHIKGFTFTNESYLDKKV